MHALRMRQGMEQHPRDEEEREGGEKKQEEEEDVSQSEILFRTWNLTFNSRTRTMKNEWGVLNDRAKRKRANRVWQGEWNERSNRTSVSVEQTMYIKPDHTSARINCQDRPVDDWVRKRIAQVAGWRRKKEKEREREKGPSLLLNNLCTHGLLTWLTPIVGHISSEGKQLNPQSKRHSNQLKSHSGWPLSSLVTGISDRWQGWLSPSPSFSLDVCVWVICSRCHLQMSCILPDSDADVDADSAGENKERNCWLLKLTMTSLSYWWLIIITLKASTNTPPAPSWHGRVINKPLRRPGQTRH